MAGRNRKRKSPEQRHADRRRRVRDWFWAPVRIVLLAVLGAGLGYGAYQVAIFLRTSSALAVRQIEVHNARRTRVADLLRAGQVQEGMNIFSVDLERVERQIEELSWIRTASVRRVVPDRLVIEVAEHRAVALTSMHKVYLVSDKGEVFKRLQPGEKVDLPVITGITRNEINERPKHARQQLLRALKTIALVEQTDCLASHQLAEVHLDELLGTSMIFDPGALSVRLGQDVSQDKLGLLCELFQELERRSLVADRILLDRVDRPNWATVRLDGGLKKNVNDLSRKSERI